MELKPAICAAPAATAALLIVPYGIETLKSAGAAASSFSLLIVPYGIETCNLCGTGSYGGTFNRTLWN